MQTVELFRALGDPIRLRIVRMLAENGETCVCKIVEELKMTQPAISQHLAKLKNSGVLRAEKRGQWVFYSLDLDVLESVGLAFFIEMAKATKISNPTPCC